MHKLPDITTDFAGWYNDIIHQAELVDDGPSRGSMVIRPYGYAIWEHVVGVLDEKIKKAGAHNAYFPLFIPESFIKKEAKHVEGFAPELAVVTHAGGKELDEPLVVRPTSETVIYHMFAKWIKSWRDLPLKINQWANVVRWEMRTRPFLRSTEFLWQEGHTAHYDREEAVAMAQHMLAEYKDLCENFLAIPVVTGEKTPSERFAGADHTFTFEGMMQDGKALQMGTSHVLAHSFPEAFGVKFQDKDGNMQSPYCTSWGATTRLIGAMVMVHGDQSGLVVPPRVAPIQIVIVPIFRKDADKEAVLGKAQELAQQINNAGMRCIIDDDTQTSPGAKFYNWEQKGVPLRIEIGPRDLEKGHVVVAKRIVVDVLRDDAQSASPQDDTPAHTEPAANQLSRSAAGSKKSFVQFDVLESELQTMLDEMHDALLARARSYMKQKWHHVKKLDEFGTQLDKRNGFYQAGWCGKAACEEQLKKYKGTIRCILQEKSKDVCFGCDETSENDVVVAKAY